MFLLYLFIMKSIDRRAAIKKLKTLIFTQKSEPIPFRTKIEKELLQRKVRALSPESLDLDQLEESAMRILNMASPDDKVILK